MYFFSYLEPVCCSMSSSICCFLTCIQISQEAGQVVWYSHHLKNFPQFIVIHTVKGFGIVNKAEIDVFPKFSCFLSYPVDVSNLISGSSAFSKTSLNIWKFTVHILLKPGWIWFRSYLNGTVVFPTFFNLSLNLAIRSSWSEAQSAPGLFSPDCIELVHLWLQRIQSIWFWCWPSGDVPV